MSDTTLTPTYAQGDAAHGPYKVNSLLLTTDVNPLEADVRWDPGRSLWNGGMLLASIVLAPLFATWSAVAVCFALLLVTMCTGHHAFPASARHGLYPGQLDLGYEFVRLLERVGLAWEIQTPASLPPRSGITPVAARAEYVATERLVRPRSPG